MYTKFYVHKWEKSDDTSEGLVAKAGLKMDENEGELGEAIEALVEQGLNVKIQHGKVFGKESIIVWIDKGDFIY